MLPGIGGLVGLVGGGVVTEFYRDMENGSVTAPAVTSARITAFGCGGFGGDFNNQGTFSQCGAGAACVQSLISIIPGEILYINARSYGGPSSVIRNAGGAILVSAAGANNYGDPGTASSSVGDVKYDGGYGYTDGAGGGAGGTNGPANRNNRGPGMTFTRTSDGSIATNGNGGSVGTDGQSYGGGGGAGRFAGESTVPGKGIVIIEWGYGQ